ncbi:MAG: L-rhamnose mutarotase [Bacillota bacterium]|jgi:L-rhamnose mutarotase|nr:L-rhamnose mutarotase [Bacillota bacterium]
MKDRQTRNVNKWIETCIVALLLWGACGWAFSPYENYLLSGRTTHVALIAQVKPGQEKALANALLELTLKKPARQLEHAGITNVSAFTRELQGDLWCMVYFDFSGKKNYLDAAEAFESAAPTLNGFLIPHPRAVTYGRTWLQMEWINYIRGCSAKRKPTDITAMVTGIKPEKEMEYRTLHQTVWPGVVDQMVRGHIRNFSIFLAEIGDQLYEFFYLEYMGQDAEKDDYMNRQDPVNQRWWKHTDPCQQPLPGSTDIWSPMNPVLPKPAEKGENK